MGCNIQAYEADIGCKNFVKKWGNDKAIAAYEFPETFFKSARYTRAALDFGELRPSDIGVSLEIAFNLKGINELRTIFVPINCQTRVQVIQNKTPRQVYEFSKRCIEKAKYSPHGFILMPSSEIPNQSPTYNVYMVNKTVNDFGSYD